MKAPTPLYWLTDHMAVSHTLKANGITELYALYDSEGGGGFNIATQDFESIWLSIAAIIKLGVNVFKVFFFFIFKKKEKRSIWHVPFCFVLFLTPSRLTPDWTHTHNSIWHLFVLLLSWYLYRHYSPNSRVDSFSRFTIRTLLLFYN